MAIYTVIWTVPPGLTNPPTPLRRKDSAVPTPPHQLRLTDPAIPPPPHHAVQAVRAVQAVHEGLTLPEHSVASQLPRPTPQPGANS
jgi:hypothetical protein